MPLSGTYPVRCGECESGTLTVSERGAHTLFEMTAAPAPDVMRLVCICRGRGISLGIPVPRGGELVLTKQLSHRELDTMGLIAVESAVLIPIDAPLPAPAPVPDAEDGYKPPAVPASADGWLPANEPWTLFADAKLQDICRTVTGALRREANGAVLLAVPVSESAPFPLIGFLTLAVPQDIAGRKYAVFTLKHGEISENSEQKV